MRTKGNASFAALARAKTLPRRVFPRLRIVPLPRPKTLSETRVVALGRMLEVLAELATHAERMQVLAACAAMHDDPDEAAFFLAQAVEDDRARCGRCGRAAKLSRWRNDP